jgi:hypothetical protein
MFRCKDLYISLASPVQDLAELAPLTRDQKPSGPNCQMIGQLANLREYLVRALAITVELEKEAEEIPQTAEEVAKLEEKLEEALEVLRAHKAELDKEAA